MRVLLQRYFNILYIIYFLSFRFIEPMSCIVYSEGPGFFEVTKERDVILS